MTEKEESNNDSVTFWRTAQEGSNHRVNNLSLTVCEETLRRMAVQQRM